MPIHQNRGGKSAVFDKRLWSRNFILINLCVTFASFTNFAYIYILPVHVTRIGGTNTDVGLMGVLLMLVGLATRFAFAPLIDTRGRKPMLVSGTLLFALNSMGYILLKDSVAGILLMRCVSGFSQGIFFPVPPTCISDVSPREKLVDALGVFGGASALAAILSPAVGLHLYEKVNPAAFFTVTAAFALLSVVFAILYQDPYRPALIAARGRRAFKLDTVLELSVLMPCLTFFFGSFGFSAVNNFAIVYGESRAIPSISLFFSVHNIAIVLSRIVAGRLVKLLSSRKLIVIGLALASLGILLVGPATGLPMMLLASATIAFGGTVYSQYLQAEVLLRVPDERRGVANSSVMIFQDVGQGLGAAFFGITSEHLGYPFTFAAAAVTSFISIPAYLLERYKRRKP